MRNFSETYFEAREKFLDISKKTKAEITSYQHPLFKTLFIDTAYIGPKNPSSLLLVVSGVHGTEGFIGSAIQCAFLESLDKSFLSFKTKSSKEAQGILCIHALNPYGFAHLQRETEENVDLNRNFCDFTKPLSKNPFFTPLAKLLVFEGLFTEKRAKADAILQELSEKHPKAFLAALMQGQYEHKESLFYGGIKPTWSSEIYLSIIKQFTHVPKIGLIDFHTGYGEFGNKEFYTLASEKSIEHKETKEILKKLLPVISEPYPIRHSLVEKTRQMFPFSKVLGGSVEFGTCAPSALNALREDCWLRFYGKESRREKEIKARMKEALFPSSVAWRLEMLKIGTNILNHFF